MLPPETIVFDIGRVLVDFSLESFAGFLRANGAAITDRTQFISETGMRDYEMGRISSASFLSRISSLMHTPADHLELSRRWQSIFSPIPEMFELLERLSGKFRLLLLSNTNELHWQYLDGEYRLSSRVDGVVTSFQEGALKPSAAIFRAAERRYNLNPAATVFIDDIAEHITAAQGLGWRGIQHNSVSATMDQLAEMGVSL